MFIDLHCDTLHSIQKYNCRLAANRGSVDAKKLAVGGALCQCFAAFTDTKVYPDAYANCLHLADIFERELRANSGRLRRVTNASEIMQAHSDGLVGAMLTVEEGEGVCEPDRLRKLYSLGARISSVTWNYENSLAAANTKNGRAAPVTDRGLTQKGADFVAEANRLHMLIDVSHLSDRGFYDVVKLSTLPPIATHSNARAVADHPRNMTDDMIATLAKAGGVMGLNFFHSFLHRRGDDVSHVADMLRHLKHIRNVGGAGVMALGTDFDGISGSLELPSSAAIPRLAQQMKLSGFTESEIDGFLYKNALQLFSNTLL